MYLLDPYKAQPHTSYVFTYNRSYVFTYNSTIILWRFIRQIMVTTFSNYLKILVFHETSYNGI